MTTQTTAGTQAMQQAGQTSPKQILQQCVQQCEQSKQQMVNQLKQIQDPHSATAFQMAINAVDNCIAQCHTAGGVVH